MQVTMMNIDANCAYAFLNVPHIVRSISARNALRDFPQGIKNETGLGVIFIKEGNNNEKNSIISGSKEAYRL